MRICLFGYELIIQKSYFTGFHYTDYKRDSDYSDKPYELKYSMDKRVEALAGHDRYIDWVFARFPDAIRVYESDAIDTLNIILIDLVRKRNKLKLAGATEEQLSVFDNKVYKCFNLVLFATKNRILSDTNKHIEIDTKLLEAIKNYDIKKYHLLD